MNKTDSFSARVKAELCKKTRCAFGFEPGEKSAQDCCKLSFFSAALLFAGEKQADDSFLLQSANAEFLDLVASLGAASYSLNPILSGKTLLLADSPALRRVFRAAGIHSDSPVPVLLCGDCLSYYLRAVFLACGTVAAPENEYHLELSCKSLSSFLLALCKEAQLPFAHGTRRGNEILYLKGADQIEDFLARVGASGSAMEMMNAQMEKSVRALVNRQNNFDTANLSRTLEFSRRFSAAVETLRQNGGYDSLPPSLKQVARARLRYPADTLLRLGERLSPPLSKSGLYHRAKKLIDLAEKKEF